MTSLALGLAIAAQRRGHDSLLVEADPAGGVLGLRFGLSASPSLATFSGDIRRDVTAPALFANTQEILGVPTLIAPTDPLDSNRQITKSADGLASLLTQLPDRFIAVDLGRVTTDSKVLALGAAADLVLIASDSSIEGLQSALYLQRLLRVHSCAVAITLVGALVHEVPEIADVTDASILGHIPWSPRASAALRGGRFKLRQFTRSSYWRSIDSLYLALSDLPTTQRSSQIDHPVPQHTADTMPPPPTGPNQVAPENIAPAQLPVAPPSTVLQPDTAPSPAKAGTGLAIADEAKPPRLHTFSAPVVEPRIVDEVGEGSQP